MRTGSASTNHASCASQRMFDWRMNCLKRIADRRAWPPFCVCRFAMSCAFLSIFQRVPSQVGERWKKSWILSIWNLAEQRVFHALVLH